MKPSGLICHSFNGKTKRTMSKKRRQSESILIFLFSRLPTPLLLHIPSFPDSSSDAINSNVIQTINTMDIIHALKRVSLSLSPLLLIFLHCHQHRSISSSPNPLSFPRAAKKRRRERWETATRLTMTPCAMSSATVRQCTARQHTLRIRPVQGAASVGHALIDMGQTQRWKEGIIEDFLKSARAPNGRIEDESRGPMTRMLEWPIVPPTREVGPLFFCILTGFPSGGGTSLSLLPARYLCGCTYTETTMIGR
jgi:hypothetical protein